MGMPTRSLSTRCVAEMLGTFLLVFFGCGAVHVAVLTGALAGLWQVAIVWAVAIAVTIHIIGSISGAHINPAITIAFAVWGRFRWIDVVPYSIAQLIGATAAAAVLFLLYGPFLTEKERDKGVVRGAPGSEITAMCYGEFFPNPGRIGDGATPYQRDQHDRHNALVSEPTAFFAELLGTMILALAVFAVTDERNAAAPPGRLAPVFIGLTVAALIAVLAPLTQACFNPARDVGPRLFSIAAGWGWIALGRGTGFVTVYVLAPILGAVAGGGLYQSVLRRSFPEPAIEREP